MKSAAGKVEDKVREKLKMKSTETKSNYAKRREKFKMRGKKKPFKKETNEA